MYYPGAIRLRPSESKRFYKQSVKPQLPEEVAMPNHGHNSPLRLDLTDEMLELLSSNTQLFILRSL